MLKLFLSAAVAACALGITLILTHTWWMPPFFDVLGYLAPLPQNLQVDVIVVLSAGEARTAAGARFYNAGVANTILLNGNDEIQGIMQPILARYGIPNENILELQGDANTYSEAQHVIQFLMERQFRSALIVTDIWHSRRAYCTYRALNNDEIRFYVWGEPMAQTRDNWWTGPSMHLVFEEHIKTWAYGLVYQVTPFCNE